MKKISFAIIIPFWVMLWPFVSFSAEHADVALYLMRMINDIRKSPKVALEAIGVDPVSARADMGAGGWVLDQGLPPLAWNDQLHASALSHARDMVQRIYYGHVSPDGTTVAQRIIATGYQPLYTGESLGILAFDRYIDPVKAAEIMLVNILDYESGSTIALDNRNILGENRTELGIAMISAVVDLGLGVPVNIYLVVADFATPSTPRSFIIGNVFEKSGSNPVNLQENGIPGLKIEVSYLLSGSTWQDTTRSNGFFQFPASDKFMTMEVWDETGFNLLARRVFFMQSQNILVEVFVDK